MKFAKGKNNTFLSLSIALMTLALLGCTRLPEPAMLFSSDLEGPDRWRNYVLAIQQFLHERGTQYYLAKDVLYSEQRALKVDRRAAIFDPTFDLRVENVYAIDLQESASDTYSFSVLFMDVKTWASNMEKWKGFSGPMAWEENTVSSIMKSQGEKYLTFNTGDDHLVLIGFEFGNKLDRELIQKALDKCREYLIKT